MRAIHPDFCVVRKVRYVKTKNLDTRKINGWCNCRESPPSTNADIVITKAKVPGSVIVLVTVLFPTTNNRRTELNYTSPQKYAKSSGFFSTEDTSTEPVRLHHAEHMLIKKISQLH